ncbi:acyloxyacyl hydrolase [Marixanthomonas spongiae]|uniref:Deacylase n=1 Tax=Marixanthomonas spongiae TaxID=2174845 RepID=A0A2U0HU28_9FLAO|nr:acyloxyacyl hydrolase [Marixanthomonas spongiae]PVW12329.1 deacylase [Marixanthomonas spongiae]
MKKTILTFFLLFSFGLFAQQSDSLSKKSNFIISPEVLLGITAEANSYFPDHGLQSQAIVSFGWEHDNNPQEWAHRLKGPRTGISIGYTDFGNTENLGSAISVLPFIEFNAFKSKKLTIQVGTGASYFTKKYDPITNPNNEAVTTDFTWSFKLFSHYSVFSTNKIDWRAGIGYSHHSNGHTRLPNQGFNSFLIGVSADIKNNSKPTFYSEENKPIFLDNRYSYFAIRTGLGVQTLGKAFNDKKGVYAFSGEYGRVYNNTYKVGVGMYYRFYRHYYDYMTNNESLVQDGREFDSFKENPTWSASNLGVFVTGEVLLNHFGINLQIGFNIHKPAYNIDWRINQGWDVVPRVIPENSAIVLGEFDTKFKLKKHISSRLGLKYYIIGTRKSPQHNFFIGANLNANLGQADYTELSFGYVHSFSFKKEKPLSTK